ncbi:MAG: hypothetical protein ACR2HE_12680 [Casimicrobiaceae bacterium]
MNARTFSQPNVVHALCLTLAKLTNAPEISASLLAEAVAPAHPGVPLPVLRVFAAKVLALYFDTFTVEELKQAGLDLDDEIAASEFLGAAAAAEADALRVESNRLQ